MFVWLDPGESALEILLGLGVKIEHEHLRLPSESAEEPPFLGIRKTLGKSCLANDLGTEYVGDISLDPVPQFVISNEAERTTLAANPAERLTVRIITTGDEPTGVGLLPDRRCETIQRILLEHVVIVQERDKARLSSFENSFEQEIARTIHSTIRIESIGMDTRLFL